MEKRPTCGDDVFAGSQKNLARRRRFQSCSHSPGEHLSRIVVDDCMQICLCSVEQLEDRHVDMPSFVGSCRAYADGGLRRMKPLARATPTPRADGLGCVLGSRPAACLFGARRVTATLRAAMADRFSNRKARWRYSELLSRRDSFRDAGLTRSNPAAKMMRDHPDRGAHEKRINRSPSRTDFIS